MSNLNRRTYYLSVSSDDIAQKGGCEAIAQLLAREHIDADIFRFSVMRITSNWTACNQ